MPLDDRDLIEKARERLPDDIVVHVGMTKAGSTAIQNAFERNYVHLLNNGILFPRSIFSRINPQFQERTSGHLQLLRSALAGDLDGFIDEVSLAEGRAKRLVLSAENLFLDVDDEGLGFLRRLFDGRNVQMFCILRSQASWVPSRYYEAVVKGNRRETLPFGPYVESLIAKGELDYYERLKYVGAALGADKIVAADYDATAKDGGAVGAFLKMLGLGEPLPLAISRDESNVSFPYPEAVEAHRRLNVLTTDIPRDVYMAWCAEMEAMCAGEREARGIAPHQVEPDAAQRRRLYEACLQSNRRLSAEFLGGAPFGPGEKFLAAPDPAPLDEALTGALMTRGVELFAPHLKERLQRPIELKQRLDEATEKRRAAEAKAKAAEAESKSLKKKEASAAAKAEKSRADYANEKQRRVAVEAALALREADLKRLTAREAEAREKAGRLAAEGARLSDEVKRRTEETRALKASFSWRATAPLRAATKALSGVRPGNRLGAQAKAVAASGLFDSAWYLARYKDVAAEKIDPLAHYFRSGAGEGRDPGPGFSTRWYLSAYPDVLARGINPLYHYVAYGQKEGRKPLPPEGGPGSPGSGAPGKGGSARKSGGKGKRGPAPPSAAKRESAFSQLLSEVPAHHMPAELPALLAESETRLAEIAARLRAVKDAPLVSIVMPTFNRAGVIGEAIASVVAQDYPNWELLVCDDGSNDETREIVAGFADKRIRYLALEKRGASAARNAGLAEARGAFIAYLDSDNCWRPSFLSAMAMALIDNPGRSAAYADYIDWRRMESGGAKIKAYGQPAFDHEKLLKKNFIDLNAFMHRRELYDCFGGFNESLTRRQDYDVILKYTWLRDPLHVAEPLALYRRDPSLGQITTTMKDDASCVAVIDRAVASYFANGLPLAKAPPVKKVTVLSWDMSRNHFAKAFAVAEALSAQYEVQLVSFRFFEEAFPPLKDAKPAFETVYIQGGKFPDFFGAMKKALDAISGEVLYVVKPRLPSLGLALLAQYKRGLPIILEANDLETVVSAPKRGDRHGEEDFAALDLSAPDLVNPYSDLWSRALDPLARSLPVIVTHNRGLDEHFGRRALYLRNLKDERVYDPARYDRAAARAAFGFAPEDRVILFGGMVREHKGVNQLVELVRRLGDPRVKLVVAGSRENPDQARLVAEHGTRVRVLPPQNAEAMAKLNLAADLVILWLDPEVPASHYQMPYKATDALAMGTPIIANDVSDLKTLGEQGYLTLVPFGDFDAMAQGVAEIFSDPAKARARCAAGRRLFERQFSYAAGRGAFALALGRAQGGAGKVSPAAQIFTHRFNEFYRRQGADGDFMPARNDLPPLADAQKEIAAATLVPVPLPAQRASKPAPAKAAAPQRRGNPLTAFAQRLRGGRVRKAIAASGLFDAGWYLKRYPDVAAARIDPLTHYLAAGAAEGRDPGPGFSTSAYLIAHPDVAESRVNPLYHYAAFGQKEGRALAPDALTDIDEDGRRRLKPAKQKQPETPALRARRLATDMRNRALRLGFHERGLAELKALAAQTEDPLLAGIAAWELALVHANRGGEESAREALALLAGAHPGDDDPAAFARRLAVIRAECEHRLGREDEARAVLSAALAAGGPHADLFLGMARLPGTDEERLGWANKALTLHGLSSASLREGAFPSLYDRLAGAKEESIEGAAKVSIIIPAYNAAGTIGTAIDSLLAQSWRNLEVLVSDDCSTDATADVVAAYAQKDSRVRLIRGKENSGPYVARNLALKEATGAFATCNDSDDWSHPKKIEIQARHLLANERVMANTSPQARTDENLVFSRRGNPGFYIQFNMSSLMFRREPALARLGYWDSVRFAADSEYTRRIKKVFGEASLVDLDCGPLSFQRQTETSLTGSSSFGYHGFKMGARREYEESHNRFHQATPAPFLDFPQASRPFYAPEPMRPRRTPKGSRRHFDIVMVSDFRLPGGTSMSNAEEIKAQKRFGLKTGLVQMSLFHLSNGRPMNPKIAELIDGDATDLIVYGERASCDLLVLRLPWVLEERQEYIPEIDAKNIRVIVNQPPKRSYDAQGETIYRIPHCAAEMRKLFGDAGIWHPIGPLVREALVKHHGEDLAAINLSDEDWVNIIDIAEWRRSARPPAGPRIRICRHSRDQYVKWPNDRETLLQAYPDSSRFEINVLGGAEVPKEVCGGRLPKNWRVTEFGKVAPQRFLADHDVFVYYTHPDWVESFGRVIFEAMAVGLPAILPPIYEPLFKDAAIYAEPKDVARRAEEIMSDTQRYNAQVERALAYVERQFGYASHEARLRAAIAEGERAQNDNPRGRATILSEARG